MDIKKVIFHLLITILLISIIIISFITIFTISFGFNKDDVDYKLMKIGYFNISNLDISLEKKYSCYRKINSLSTENINPICFYNINKTLKVEWKGMCPQLILNIDCNEYNSKKYSNQKDKLSE